MARSQNEQLLAYLTNHPTRGITPREAFLLLGIMRLAARIMELRRAGNIITTDHETAHGATYARYRLVLP